MRASSESRTNPVIQWLLEGDPSIRWQVLRDLLGTSESAVEHERRKVARIGWERVCSRSRTPRASGLAAVRPTAACTRLSGFPPPTPCCCSAILVCRPRPAPRDAPANCSSMEAFSPTAAPATAPGHNGLVVAKPASPEWSFPSSPTSTTKTLVSTPSAITSSSSKCPSRSKFRRYQGATHSSVHTTISTLEGLRFYELLCRGNVREIRAAQDHGREFLLVHRLFRSHRTGKIINAEFTRFSFPPPDGTTTFSAHLIIFRPSTLLAIHASQRPSKSSTTAG